MNKYKLRLVLFDDRSFELSSSQLVKQVIDATCQTTAPFVRSASFDGRDCVLTVAHNAMAEGEAQMVDVDIVAPSGIVISSGYVRATPGIHVHPTI